MHGLTYENLEQRIYDLIINGTAAGSNNDPPLIPAELVNSQFLCYDIMYNLNAETGFVAWSRASGAAHACDGLGILVEQAAESFRICHGIRPDTTKVINALKQS